MSDKLENFEVDIEMSLPRRIAAFLDYAAEVAPGRPIPFQLLTKIVMMLPKRPTETDARVVSIRDALRRAKPFLMDQYRRGLVSQPGFGVRATTDTDDLARTQFQQDARRVTSAIKSIDRTRSLIKTSDITDKDLRARVTSVNGAVRVLVSGDVLGKLLPEKKA